MAGKDRNAFLYETFGGKAACRRLSKAFYGRVEQDPVLRPLFPGKTFTCAIEEFSAFLSQFLGGPGEDSQRRWWVSLHESHLRFKIGQRERQAWMANMARALEDAQIREPMRSEILHFFERSSAYVVNQQQGDAISGDASSTADESTRAEISRRWDAQLRLDEAVAAIRSGDADRAIELAKSQTLETFGPSAFCALLALMIRSGQPVLLQFAHATLSADPSLAQQRYAGRTLLHEAAAHGNVETVELLMQLGANPDSPDSGGHTPLYWLANGRLENGGHVVRALVQAGADVNAHEGVKQCTPLHMAARRGNIEVAEALLDCGANLESRDSLGETPLRRAVNCNQVSLASVLIARGADVQSKGKKGSTPLLAARSTAMKERLLQAVARPAGRHT